MRITISLVIVLVILLGCNLGTQISVTATPPPPTAIPATDLPTEAVVVCESAPVGSSILRVNPEREQSPGCYLMYRGEQFTITWDGALPEGTQMVEFFRNCTDPEAPLMECTDKATDNNGSDGYSVTFFVPQTFEEVIITAIAYGSAQGSAQDSGAIAIVIREQ